MSQGGGGCGGQRVPVDRLTQHGGQRLCHVVPLEETPTGEHFVEHDAEGPDVGAAIDAPALRLLRGHVRRRAENEAELGRRVG